jgi:ABC-type Fe3+-siderophore transport system permease subunit
MREIAILRGAASGIFCGVLFWLGLMFTHGTSDVGWEAFYLLPVAAVLMGPLALVVWSIVSGERRSAVESRIREFR